MTGDPSTSAQPEPHRRSSWGCFFIAFLVFDALVVAVLLWWLFFRNAPPDAKPSISEAEALKLEALKNLAVAHLENEDYAAADESFVEIIDKLPQESLGLQNLAIARLLALEARTIPAEKAREAVEKLLQNDSDSPVAHILAGRYAKATGNESRTQAEFSRAVELAEDDPAVQYALFRAGRDSADEQFRKRASTALATTSQLLPRNLFLLTDQLLAQAETQESSISQTLKLAREETSWLVDLIQQQNRVDIRELLDRAAQAAEQNNWPVVLTNVRMFSNVLRPQPATQSDLRRIDKHPLEFVVREFSPEFRKLLKPSAEESPIEVTFMPFSEAEQLPELKDLRAVELIDFDLDGRLDVVALRGQSLEVFGRIARKNEWARLTQFATPTGFEGMVVADLDNERGVPANRPQQTADAACHEVGLDLVLFGPAGVLVLKNMPDEAMGSRTLQTVDQEPAFKQLQKVLAVAVADLDHDGDLDLAISTETGLSLWANRDDMTFVDISARSQLPPLDLKATSLVSIDWDRDLDLDLICNSETHRPSWLENVGHGRFRWSPFPVAGTELNSTIALDSLHTSDFDNDGRADALSWNDAGLEVSWGGSSAPAFKLPNPRSLVGPVRQIRIGDLDNDGDLDFAVAGTNRVVLVENRGGNQNHWLDISLRAEQVKGGQPSASGRVNHNGVGSLIEVRAGDSYQRQIVRGPVTHFGLGKRDAADVARVLWTNGVPANIIRPRADQHICEKQTLKGSCPYLYTWTGERFEFFTDLLWAAPLGLQFAEGVYAPPRAWEYLKIPGDRLRERDGTYRLQITEELWEAAYFDQVELLAVDHPAEVAIYSNEKVGPAEIAAFKVHTVQSARPPVAARDQRGRDVLETIRREDDVYVKAFDVKHRQGLAEEHFLELDLGQFEKKPQQFTLFLTGWIYPTDTSINVALGQSRQLRGPRPPAIWVPDENGTWREVVPYMGFPGGKTKTIAVDLSRVFLTNDYRVRIVTTAEICWDAAWFTIDERPAEFTVTPLALRSADLHYRGFSAAIEHSQFGPERYDYAIVDRAPRWPPMGGFFTRYGDVTELVRATDDRLAIFGAGDEMTVEFAAIPPPRAGWVRDFILHNVGWDKDADLNTVYGQTVEPLPFGAMSGYPYTGSETYPDDPQLQHDIQHLHTRQQNASRFWNALHRSEN